MTHTKITDFNPAGLRRSVDEIRNPLSRDSERCEKMVLDAALALADHLDEGAPEVDPEPWVDDCFGGRWSGEKMNAYKAHGSSFNFAYEPRH